MATTSSEASSPRYLVVLVTIDDRQSAVAIARSLVEEGLAACVQIGGPIDSVYVWKGAVETAVEWTLSIKTRTDLYVRLERRVSELHPYEQPQILAIPVLIGSAGYLGWVDDSTGEATSAGVST